ncbi:craniofacial development protein 2-like protein [Plakobranchus ocellatus]|uniref:Craniofacial development protein 2-like protein n=1 Tax=Plakobranchus ocellatus TaxID=259542 RepID=A0AAV3Y0D8_9GAST|nr:craniofacial development protein 2-like protein [Plakobranchus ocellatus]
MGCKYVRPLLHAQTFVRPGRMQADDALSQIRKFRKELRSNIESSQQEDLAETEKKDKYQHMKFRKELRSNIESSQQEDLAETEKKDKYQHMKFRNELRSNIESSQQEDLAEVEKKDKFQNVSVNFDERKKFNMYCVVIPVPGKVVEDELKATESKLGQSASSSFKTLSNSVETAAHTTIRLTFKALGPTGDEKSGNLRGEKLVEWCKMNNLIIGNTWFQQPPRRKWTWKSPGEEIRNQIDFILLSHRFRNALLSAKSYPGADCYSDHAPVTAKFKLKHVCTTEKAAVQPSH